MQRVDDAINQLCVYDYQVLCTSLMLLSVEVGIGPSRTSTSMFFRLTMDDRISNTARNGHSKESCKLQTPSNSKVLLILIFHSYFHIPISGGRSSLGSTSMRIRGVSTKAQKLRQTMSRLSQVERDCEAPRAEAPKNWTGE